VRVGITGHQRLTADSAWDWVRRELESILRRTPGPLVGVSSLAMGADQLFAGLALSSGGSLEVVLPFESYSETFAEERDAREFERLLRSASKVETLRRGGSNEEAYMEAGKRIVDTSDLLIAVWDGRPAVDLGGTADVVRYAVGRGKPVVHLNPVTGSVGSA
jgi:hypothetical protein